MSRPPILVVAVGNLSRGDDAVGPLALEHLERALAAQLAAGRLELLSDFQLQPEHALDLAERVRVVFVDASVTAAPPYAFTALAPAHDRSASTHALSPAAVLEVGRRLGEALPEAWCLAIRGERFELGEPLGASARANLAAACAHLEALLTGWCDEARADGGARPPGADGAAC